MKDANLAVNPYECVAIEGGRQSGKTTLLSLMGGLLFPSEGEVLVDRKNMNRYQTESVRRQIGYLAQNPVLFNGTIMENLTLFQERDFEEGRVEKVAALIGLDSIIKALPEGYETIVADRATEKLSRGISQRIVIARTLLREPPIILFDEANSAIDLQGDVFIRKLLKQLVGRCTLILVSNRPSLLNLAEKHYLLEDGKIRVVEQ